MGGAAFAQAFADGEPTLNTLRMDPALYNRLKQTYLDKLRAYFKHGQVNAMIEAPEKTSYGDIDFCIAIDDTVDFLDLAKHLGAAGVVVYSPKKATLALTRDGEMSTRPCVLYKDKPHASSGEHSAGVDPVEYAQVDVEVIAPSAREWYMFYSSYSDMAGLLGRIVSPGLGFTVSDRGMEVRLPELDLSKTVKYANVNVADRDGYIFLSNDFKMIIKFLGCSVERYERGFTTLRELYEWLGECRFLSALPLQVKRDGACERRREQTRPVYCGFYHDWLPAHMAMQSELSESERVEKLLQLREQHLEEAVQSFDKAEEYRTKRAAVVLTMANGLAASLLKPLIAEHSGKAAKQQVEILRAFRRYVGFNASGGPSVLSDPHSDDDSELHKFLNQEKNALQDPEATSAWVRAHWDDLRTLERQRAKA